MKKLMIIVTITSFLLTGCNAVPVSNVTLTEREVVQLKDKLESQAKVIQSKDEELAIKIQEIEQLEKRVDELELDIEKLSMQTALGKGYAGQFMFDLKELYNHLDCPLMPKTDVKTTKVIDRLILELSKSEIYSDKKIISIKVVENDGIKEGHYTFEVLMFTSIELDQLLNSIDKYESPPFSSMRLYSISVSLKDDEFNFDVN